MVAPPDAPTRFDYVLGGMGVSMAFSGVVGVASAVPVAVASGVGSLLAACILLAGTAGEY